MKIDRVRVDDAAKKLDEREKGVIFKNCARFADCMTEINNTQIDKAKNIDAVMPKYNLIEYNNNNNNSKIAGSSWQYYRYEPNDDKANSGPFKLKVKTTGQNPDNDNKKKLK